MSDRELMMLPASHEPLQLAELSLKEHIYDHLLLQESNDIELLINLVLSALENSLSFFVEEATLPFDLDFLSGQAKLDSIGNVLSHSGSLALLFVEKL